MGEQPTAEVGAIRGWIRSFSRETRILAVILLVAAVLRLVGLESSPPGLFRDEAAIAANACSIGIAGRSLSGQRFPLYFEERSYEEWGAQGIVYQPVYTYASVPFVRILGFSRTAIRLPSVFFGLLGIVGLYLLAKELGGPTLGLIAAALMAVSPWHHHFSRIAFEGISLLPFLTFGLWLLLRGLERPAMGIAGAGILTMAIYTYPTAKVFVPLLLAGFAVINARTLRTSWRHSAAAAGVVLILALPDLYCVLADVHQDRTHRVLISSGNLEQERAVTFLRNWESEGSLASAILARNGLLTVFVFSYNYLTYFSPSFLFLSGDPKVHLNPEGWGEFPLYAIPLLGVGLAVLLRKRSDPRWKFLLYAILIFPVPASLTLEGPHALRSLNGLPFLLIVAAAGAEAAWSAARSKPSASLPSWIPRAAGLLLLALYVAVPFEATRYFMHYHREYAVYSAPAWQAGVDTALRSIENRKKTVDMVYLSPEIYNSYLFVLVTAAVDFRSLDPSQKVNDQLKPYKYQVRWPENVGRMNPGDVWLVTASEFQALPGADVLEEFPFPDKSPNLFLIRPAGR